MTIYIHTRCSNLRFECYYSSAVIARRGRDDRLTAGQERFTVGDDLSGSPYSARSCLVTRGAYIKSSPEKKTSDTALSSRPLSTSRGVAPLRGGGLLPALC